MWAVTLPSMVTEAYLTRWITVFILAIVALIERGALTSNKSKLLFLIGSHLVEVFEEFGSSFCA